MSALAYELCGSTNTLLTTLNRDVDVGRVTFLDACERHLTGLIRFLRTVEASARAFTVPDGTTGSANLRRKEQSVLASALNRAQSEIEGIERRLADALAMCERLDVPSWFQLEVASDLSPLRTAPAETIRRTMSVGSGSGSPEEHRSLATFTGKDLLEFDRSLQAAVLGGHKTPRHVTPRDMSPRAVTDDELAQLTDSDSDSDSSIEVEVRASFSS
jgi:hypothetical protein